MAAKWTQEELNYVHEFYKEQTAKQIGEVLERSTAAVGQKKRELGLSKPKRTNGEGHITVQGYHTYAQRYIQRIVWELTYGPIPPKHEVHHIDGNKLNNELSNLRCLSLSEHRRAHSKNWKKENGQWLRRCTGCKEWKSEADYSRQHGSVRSYCKSCSTIRRGLYRDKCRLKDSSQSKT